jgi:hypothetical protein
VQYCECVCHIQAEAHGVCGSRACTFFGAVLPHVCRRIGACHRQAEKHTGSTLCDNCFCVTQLPEVTERLLALQTSYARRSAQCGHLGRVAMHKRDAWRRGVGHLFKFVGCGCVSLRSADVTGAFGDGWGGLCASEVNHACETLALVRLVYGACICCVVLLPPEGFAEGGWGFPTGVEGF